MIYRTCGIIASRHGPGAEAGRPGGVDEAISPGVGDDAVMGLQYDLVAFGYH
jgi:hypothetical protein